MLALIITSRWCNYDNIAVFLINEQHQRHNIALEGIRENWLVNDFSEKWTVVWRCACCFHLFYSASSTPHKLSTFQTHAPRIKLSSASTPHALTKHCVMHIDSLSTSTKNDDDNHIRVPLKTVKLSGLYRLCCSC